MASEAPSAAAPPGKKRTATAAALSDDNSSGSTIKRQAGQAHQRESAGTEVTKEAAAAAATATAATAATAAPAATATATAGQDITLANVLPGSSQGWLAKHRGAFNDIMGALDNNLGRLLAIIATAKDATAVEETLAKFAPSQHSNLAPLAAALHLAYHSWLTGGSKDIMRTLCRSKPTRMPQMVALLDQQDWHPDVSHSHQAWQRFWDAQGDEWHDIRDWFDNHFAQAMLPPASTNAERDSAQCAWQNFPPTIQAAAQQSDKVAVASSASKSGTSYSNAWEPYSDTKSLQDWWAEHGTTLPGDDATLLACANLSALYTTDDHEWTPAVETIVKCRASDNSHGNPNWNQSTTSLDSLRHALGSNITQAIDEHGEKSEQALQSHLINGLLGVASLAEAGSVRGSAPLIVADSCFTATANDAAVALSAEDGQQDMVPDLVLFRGAVTDAMPSWSQVCVAVEFQKKAFDNEHRGKIAMCLQRMLHMDSTKQWAYGLLVNTTHLVLHAISRVSSGNKRLMRSESVPLLHNGMLSRDALASLVLLCRLAKQAPSNERKIGDVTIRIEKWLATSTTCKTYLASVVAPKAAAGAQQVVLKELQPGLEDLAKHEAAALEELKALADDGCIPKLIAYEGCCLVVSYMGKTLADFLGTGVSAVAAQQIGRSLHRAITKLHNAEWLHLDIRSRNVCVAVKSQDGRDIRVASLIDFGAAVKIGSTVTSKSYRGTVQTASPAIVNFMHPNNWSRQYFDLEPAADATEEPAAAGAGAGVGAGDGAGAGTDSMKPAPRDDLFSYMAMWAMLVAQPAALIAKQRSWQKLASAWDDAMRDLRDESWGVWMSWLKAWDDKAVLASFDCLAAPS